MTNDTDFTGKHVLVVGGSSGIGNGIAHGFRERGATVHVWGTRANPAEYDPADGSDLSGLGYTCVDVGDPDAIEAAPLPFDTLDVLVLCQGTVVYKRGEFERPGWKMQAMNVMTAATITKLALPQLKKSAQGRVINMGAGGAVKADMGMGAYAASKAGVHKLTEALAVELLGTSVTVNAILPSIIDTPTNRKDMPDAEPATWVAPADLAAVILFLASPESRAMTGALVPVTGRV